MKKIHEILQQLDEGDELQRQAADLIRNLSGEVPKEFILVSQKPTEELLVSMATRTRHDFLLPSDPNNPFSMSDQARQSILSDMEQLHEEVVGRGFFKPSNASFYKIPGKTGP